MKSGYIRENVPCKPYVRKTDSDQYEALLIIYPLYPFLTHSFSNIYPRLRQYHALSAFSRQLILYHNVYRVVSFHFSSRQLPAAWWWPYVCGVTAPLILPKYSLGYTTMPSFSSCFRSLLLEASYPYCFAISECTYGIISISNLRCAGILLSLHPIKCRPS